MYLFLLTFLLAASAAILAADFLGGLPRPGVFSGDLLTSEESLVLPNVVTSVLITAVAAAVLALLGPFLAEGVAVALPFLVPTFEVGWFFLPLFLDSGVALSESASLLSLNILFARAEIFSAALVAFCKDKHPQN